MRAQTWSIGTSCLAFALALGGAPVAAQEGTPGSEAAPAVDGARAVPSGEAPESVGAPAPQGGEGTVPATASDATSTGPTPPAATAPGGPPPSTALPFAYSLSGYFRARGATIVNPFLGQADYTDVGSSPEDDATDRLRALKRATWFEQGLRLSPKVAYEDLAVLQLDLDVLEGVVWGDNAGLASTPAFAGAPSANDRFGAEVDTFAARRAWLDVKLPLGLLRVGRQPGHWGMGLLANKGDGLEADFGDYHYGTTYDRVLFATRPVDVVRGILGRPAPVKSPLTLALAFDKLVADAITDALDSERACSSCAPQIQLADNRDDVDQWVGALLYKDEDARIVAATDRVVAGAYVVNRRQRGTRTDVWILDGYADLRIGHGGLEAEVLWLSGRSSALSGENPKKIGVFGCVARGGYYDQLLDLLLEVGYAPGDDDPTDPSFSGFALHPDHNVGLLLYKEVLAARTARVWSGDASGLRSRGGVYNSKYVQPKVRVRPLARLTAILGVLWARANKNDGVLWAENREPKAAGDLDLGFEVDMALRYDLAAHAHLKLEGGVFFPGRALWKDQNTDLQITVADRADPAYTLQARLGFVF
ncbi:MAG: alginate export family protein [Deltaproteobacteria bacterium]|nr:alginate export family protein [Deltaproteobacteria bacterium]